MRIQRIVHTEGDTFHNKYPEAQVYIYVEGVPRSSYYSVRFNTSTEGSKEKPQILSPSFSVTNLDHVELYMKALHKALGIAAAGWHWVMTLPQGETWVEE